MRFGILPEMLRDTAAFMDIELQSAPKRELNECIGLKS
jgi:hypothetical protein